MTLDRRWLGVAGAAVVVVAATAAAVLWRDGTSSPGVPAIDAVASPTPPSPSPHDAAPSPGPPSPGAVRTADARLEVADLDRVVGVAEDADDAEDAGRIRLLYPDGRESAITIGTPRPSAVPWYVDAEAGVVWQSADDPAAPVVRATEEGATTLAGGDGDADHRLVGIADGGHWALVERRTGTTPEDMTADLLRVPLDGGEPEVQVSGIAGWESGVTEAAAVESVLYARMASVSYEVIADRPDADPVTVFEGGDETGEYVNGVGMDQTEHGFALVERAGTFPEPHETWVLAVDVGTGAVTERIDVPLGLGIGDTWAVARDVSATDELLLVNRDAEGTWLRPLVFDRSTRTWAELDVVGRARLGPRPQPEPPPPPPCATEDAALANAAPAGDRLHLYLPCTGEAEPHVVHRLDVGPAPSGDVEDDVRGLLSRLLAPPETGLEERGYVTFEHVDMRVRDVALASDGLLVVDLSFDAEDVGGLNTAHASVVWHTTVLANLHQFPEVTTVELRMDGDCEAYAAYFQSDGCRRFGPESAPWDRGG